MENNEINIDDLIRNMIDMIKANNEFLMHQVGELLKQKNLWIAQIITISSAILGGFFLSRQQNNLVVNLGITLLFIIVFVALLLIYRNYRNFAEGLLEQYGKSSDYYMRSLIYLGLLKKQNLTEEESRIKVEIGQYFKDFFQEIGLIKENGSLGSIYEKLYQNKNVDWINYLLIVMFFLTGLILAFSTYIAKYLGLSIR